MSKKIAITGGIGSGKSFVSELIKALGYPVFSCDEIYKDVIVSPAYIEKIRLVFPECVTEKGIDRKKLSAIVFRNPEKLQLLNGIAHPLIMEKLFQNMNELVEEFVFAEVPLLFESNTQALFEKIIVVQRNVEKRMESVMQRDGLSKQEILQRMKAQFDYTSVSEDERANIYFVYNNGAVGELEDQLKTLLQNWKS